MSDWEEYFKNGRRSLFDTALRDRRIIELIVENTPKGGSVLEVGCGTARLSSLLADMGFRVTAMDKDPAVIEYAKLITTTSGIKFMVGDALDLDGLHEYRFDAVCSSGLMEHFNADGVSDSLRSQGCIADRVIFSVPNNRIKDREFLFGDENLTGRCEWLKMICGAGFNSIEVHGGYDLPRWAYLLPGFMLHRRFSFWWKLASRHFVFVCKSR